MSELAAALKAQCQRIADNPQAFPASLSCDGKSILVEGLTKREWFAGMALQVIIGTGEFGPKTAADRSVAYADALIERLKQP